MRRHLLRVLERAAIGEIGGDAGGTKRVIADRRVNAGRAPGAGSCARRRPAPWLLGQTVALCPGWCEQIALAVVGDAGGVDIGTQYLGERMVARHRVLLAAFLVQLHLPAGALGRRSSTFIFSAALMRAKE